MISSFPWWCSSQDQYVYLQKLICPAHKYEVYYLDKLHQNKMNRLKTIQLVHGGIWLDIFLYKCKNILFKFLQRGPTRPKLTIKLK